jgi:hypothetical protein
VLVVVAAVLAGAAGASASRDGTGFLFIPRHVVQGNLARVSVKVPRAGMSCALTVRYHGGSTQPGLGLTSAAGVIASWSWRVPDDVQAGAAVASVQCAGAWTISRKLVIVGRLVQPKITVEKTGFSTKPNGIGGTELSYGVILHNDSTTEEASGVSVQVNFVLPDNNLLGTDTSSVGAIQPGGDYPLGKMVTFPGLAPIARLEVVVQVDHFDAPVPQATLANMHVVPSTFNKEYVGTVEGELQNTTTASTLQSASLSAVVLDASGNVLGGGNGIAFQQLPPGAREFVQLYSGFDPIPFDQAASVLVSLTTTWKPPGT